MPTEQSNTETSAQSNACSDMKERTRRAILEDLDREGRLVADAKAEFIAAQREYVVRLYDEWNEMYFGGHLPTVTIQIAELDLVLAADYNPTTRLMRFSSNALSTFLLRERLIHEMVHVAMPDIWGHGAPFRAELQRIAEEGNKDAENGIWQMVVEGTWDDGWVGEQIGRWERFREGEDWRQLKLFSGWHELRARSARSTSADKGAPRVSPFGR